VASFSAQGLTLSFAGTPVFTDVSFSVARGEALILRGSNGAGKTSLLRCLQGAQRPDAGEVWLDGQRQRTASASYWGRVYGVLDDFSWFPELTVADHFRLHDPKVDPAQALARFDIAHLQDRIPVSLSSGQLRRAALASTVIRQWSVLLLDEPEQRLDAAGLALLVAVVDEFCQLGRTVVLSTHSDEFQAAVAGEVLLLDGP
jgi:ABC-2 type transport system ATP-binding protein